MGTISFRPRINGERIGSHFQVTEITSSNASLSSDIESLSNWGHNVLYPFLINPGNIYFNYCMRHWRCRDDYFIGSVPQGFHRLMERKNTRTRKCKSVCLVLRVEAAEGAVEGTAVQQWTWDGRTWPVLKDTKEVKPKDVNE